MGEEGKRRTAKIYRQTFMSFVRKEVDQEQQYVYRSNPATLERAIGVVMDRLGPTNAHKPISNPTVQIYKKGSNTLDLSRINITGSLAPIEDQGGCRHN